MKYKYIHHLRLKDLVCVETRELVPVILPPLEPINTYGERVRQAELEAIETYERTKEGLKK